MERSKAVKSYRELTAWQKAMDLAKLVYVTNRSWPREEIYGLTSQVQRAASSVPSNIAEGQGRFSTKEFLHHLSIAYGSLCETQTQIELARRLGYLSDPAAAEILDASNEVGKVMNGLTRSLEDRIHPDQH